MFDGIDTSLQAICLDSGTWGAFAERVQPHIEKMADGSGGRYWPEDIVAGIQVGTMQLWLVMDGAEITCALLTERIQYPRIRVLRCIGVVGHRHLRWMHLMSKLESFAATSLGCDRMEAMHQPGHERLLKTGGWRVFHYLSEKDLT